MNCVGCTGAWPSSQASRDSAFDFAQPVEQRLAGPRSGA